MSAKISELADASHLAATVKTGIELLNQSSTYTQSLKSLTPAELLRPLFCTVDVNLISDQPPTDSAASLSVDTENFVNPLLFTGEGILGSAADYRAIAQENWRFQKTSRSDADHGAGQRLL